jgi:hypothetical protein
VEGEMATKEELEEIVNGMSPHEVAALMCASAGRAFAVEGVAKELQEQGLVKDGVWKPTELGREVIDELTGVRKGPVVKDVQEPDLYDRYRRPLVNDVSSPKPGLRLVKEEEKMLEGVMQRDGVCCECGANLLKGEDVVWVIDEGIYHPDCVK